MLPFRQRLAQRRTLQSYKAAVSNCNACSTLLLKSCKTSLAQTHEIEKDESCEEQALQVHKSESKVLQKSTNKDPSFPSLINDLKIKKLPTEALLTSEKVLTEVGRVLRVFVTHERSGNMWENAVDFRQKSKDYYNLYPDAGEVTPQEVSVAALVGRLGGSLKLVGADRWVDDISKFKARNRRDMRRFGSLKIDALDFRGTALNYNGTRFFDSLAHIRYLNVGDCQEFDDFCMSRLNTLSETLEYLDLSGTKITAEGLTYLRLFPNLKWLNLSRTTKEIYKIVPYILEVLPAGCTVVVDDDRSALSYGSEVPFLHRSNPDKDHVFDEDPGIGDLALFEERYGSEVFNPSDVTHVHQLWKTPVVSPKRLTRLSNSSSQSKFKLTLLHYIKKADDHPPLF